jgi:hypothetical protein
MRNVAPLALTIAGCLAGCSGPSASSNGSAAGGSGSPPATAAAGFTGSACDHHLIAQADVQPLLSAPITSVKPLPGDPQSCVFSTDGFSTVTVSLRPGLGGVTIDSWRKGTMGSPVTTLPGVGDDAVWQADLKEVIASHNDMLCDIGAMGPQRAPTTPQNEGALCTKIFAGL